MVSAILTKNVSRATFTITLASLASSATGVGRQSTMVDNSTTDYPAAIVYLGVKSNGSAPTAGAYYRVYLIRGDGTIANDAAGASDAAHTIENSPLLGAMVVTATTNKVFYGVFDTWPLGPLGPSWGITVVNASGQALHATEGDHVKGYVYYHPEGQ